MTIKFACRGTLCWFILLLLFSGCSKSEEQAVPDKGKKLRIATTTSTKDSGLLDRLLPVFADKYKITVEVIALGSGAALKKARAGKADVVFTHSRKQENNFVNDGYGLNRRDVMYNDFVILGPPDDPAGIKGTRDVLKALKTIYKKNSPFISRGDNSGTHTKEKELWNMTGLDEHQQDRFSGFMESKSGMLKTLRIASQKQAYVLSDRGSYLFNSETLNLTTFVSGDKRLYNPYSVIAVNPTKVPGVNFDGATKFIDFITSMDGQEIIFGFGRLKYGKPLFSPLAIKGGIRASH